MKKHILIAATAALLALPNLSSTVLAASPEASEDAGAHHPKFSAEDFAAFTDARIAAHHPSSSGWGKAASVVALR
jgi:hypothetical protein